MVDASHAIELLKGTAADFEAMAKKLSQASAKADSIDLGIDQVGFLPVDEGFLEAYKRAQDFMIDILADGAKAMHEVGVAVGTAARSYERDEKAGAHRIAECDDPLDDN
ncbi:hypothetical protein [Actinopolymorpha pittospori]